VPDVKTDLEMAQEQLDTADEAVRVKNPVVKKVVPTFDEDGKVNGKETVYVVPFKGKEYRIAESVGLMPIMKFSRFQNMSTDDPRAMMAMYDLLKNCISDVDFDEFELHATETRAGAEDLLDVIQSVLEALAGRPTEPRGTSSATSGSTSRASTAKSSVKRVKG